MSTKLENLIHAVRACKTASEERAVIARESALIRTAFKSQGRFGFDLLIHPKASQAEYGGFEMTWGIFY